MVRVSHIQEAARGETLPHDHKEVTFMIHVIMVMEGLVIIGLLLEWTIKLRWY